MFFISVPPEINHDNVDLNRKLASGRTSTLLCEATGKPTPKITWYFNNTEITDEFLKKVPNILIGAEGKYIQVRIIYLRIENVLFLLLF